MNTQQNDPAKFVTCPCQHCNGGIEFEATHAGESVDCPHCKLETILFVPRLPKPPPKLVAKPKKGWLKRNLLVSILIGLGLIFFAAVLIVHYFNSDWQFDFGLVLVMALWAGLVISVLAVYLIPSIIAIARNKVNWPAILVLNLFLGWTIVGWVVALVWSIAVDNKI